MSLGRQKKQTRPYKLPQHTVATSQLCRKSLILKRPKVEKAAALQDNDVLEKGSRARHLVAERDQMIEIDAREFPGDLKAMADFLQERLKVQIRVDRRSIRIGGSDAPGTQPSVQGVKDLVKRALHDMKMREYHVAVQAGVVTIRERKVRERYARRKGTAPSARQTVPYFFPG